MVKTSKIFSRALIAGAFATLLGGCAAQAPKLEGLYFKDVPVYAPSEVKDMMGSESRGDDFVVKGMAWFMVSKDPPDKIRRWYQKQLPQATKVTSDSGDVTFSFTPKGAEEHEDVEITIYKDPKEKDYQFIIHEDVLPGKRKN